MGALTEKVEKLSERLKGVTSRIDEGVESVRNYTVAEKAKFVARIDAARKNAEEARAASRAKAGDAAARIQAAIDDAKAKLEAKKEQRDKEHWSAYIADLLEYAELCQTLAAQLSAESQEALLSAAIEAADYTEQYGE